MRAQVGGVVVGSLLLSGCTAVGVSVASLSGAMIGAGAGAAIKAGTEYELGGSVARTFPVSFPDLRQAALATFARLHIAVHDEPSPEAADVLVGRAGRRTVRMSFEPVTDVLTRVRVTVGHSLFVKDLATAEELLAQLEATANGTEVSVLRGRRERP